MPFNRWKTWFAVVLMALTAFDGAGAVALCIGSDGHIDFKVVDEQHRAEPCSENEASDGFVAVSQIGDAHAVDDCCLDIPLGADEKIPTIVSSSTFSVDKAGVAQFVKVLDLTDHLCISSQPDWISNQLIYRFHWPITSVVLRN